LLITGLLMHLIAQEEEAVSAETDAEPAASSSPGTVLIGKSK
jgi:hypothetical protein